MATNAAKVETTGARLSKLWDTLLKVTIYASGVHYCHPDAFSELLGDREVLC